MNLLYATAALLLAVVMLLAGVTRIGAWLIERRNPPVGTFAVVDGIRIHHVHIPAPEKAELPPLVFIHGASANLNDQMVPLRPPLEGRAEMLFFDRPGHGWSERGVGNNTPDAQAKVLAGLMDQYGIDRAIIVAHSFGGSLAAAFALNYPDRVAGLVFASAATHPWPGGKTSWYYRLATLPVHRLAVFRDDHLSGWCGSHQFGDRLRLRTQSDPATLSRARRDRVGAASIYIPGECYRC